MKPKLLRCTAAACCSGVLASAALFALPSSSPAASACRPWSLGTQATFAAFPFTLANATGILAKNNLCNPTIVSFTSPSALLASLAQGQITTAVQTPPVVANYDAQTSASPLQFYAPDDIFNLIFTAQKNLGIPVATSKNWKSTVAAFKGKTVGVTALGGLVDLVTRYMAKQVGLTPGVDFKIVAVGLGPTEVAAFQSGVAQIVVGDPLAATALTVPGYGVNVLNMAAHQGPPAFNGTMEAGWVATQSEIAANQSLYESIARVEQQAQAYIKNPKNKGTLTALLATSTQSSSAVAKALYPQLGSFVAPLSAKSWVQANTAYVRTGLITPPGPSYSNVVSTTVVNAVTPTKKKKK